jgi:glutathione synthase/RimK-type ligase-like ATP-grasp enzyme
MILLCGIPSESPIAKVNEALVNLGAQSVIFSQRQFADAELEWTYVNQKPTGRLHLFNCSYALEDFRAVYTRFMSETELPEMKSADEPTKVHCRRLHESFYQWLEVTDACVVNRHSAMFSNGSKPYQSQIICRYGFRIPPTLVTNDVDKVRDFQRRHKRVIYKSISGIRSIVKEFGSEDVERLPLIRYCPVQFQAWLDGFDVRVHVIGQRCLATKVVTTGTDYRYAHQEGGDTTLEAFELPEAVGDACVHLTESLGLHFSGIDLRFTSDGQVYCFEVNPMPGYSYYESNTGQPISQLLAEYLINGYPCTKR